MRRNETSSPESNALIRQLEQQQGAVNDNGQISSLLAARAARERAALAGLSSPLGGGASSNAELQLLLAQQQAAQQPDIQALLLQRRLEGLRETDLAAAALLNRRREEEILAAHLVQQRRVDEIVAGRLGASDQLLSGAGGVQSRSALAALGSIPPSASGVGNYLGASNVSSAASDQPERLSTREDSEHSGGNNPRDESALKSAESDIDQDADHDPNSDTFPYKLFRMLAEAENDGNEDIISFLSHGQAFSIHKPREFVTEIMPKYFTTSRMSSFQRQLNLYGFRRITEGRDKGGYYHESFIKGKRSLCKNIKRKKTAVKAQPNFIGGQLAVGPGGLGGLSVGDSHLAAGGLGPTLSVRQLIASSQAGLGGLGEGLGAPLLGGAAGTGLLGRAGGLGLNSGLATALAFEQRQQQQQQQNEVLQVLLRQQEQQRLAASFGASPDQSKMPPTGNPPK